MEPLQTPPLSPRPSLPLLLSATASASAARSSGAVARSRGTGRYAAAGGTFRGGSAGATATGGGPVGHTANGLTAGARGAPGEPGDGAVDDGTREPVAVAAEGERGQPHGAHPRLLQHLEPQDRGAQHMVQP
jgi:hypothetical protein